ncbi:hypothetical protein IPA_03560 [Ignicoccus pacificus DSM 13166]|uniref:polynucleotide 5'-hydroxyl-kinase n=1 Tax=Ignicoccus pacificus DSM 13166 TaxID=940294 RepID=A0A977KB31_9CREN|nr:hypothetical protein IPA_03560 [Ignicoccus pacificus DSM 13166]
MIDHKEILIPQGKFLEISGPAALRVVEGKGTLMGKVLSKSDFIIVPQWRTYVVRALEDMKVSVSLTSTSEVKLTDYNVSKVWEDKLNEVDAERVVILGPTDSGKSSVTATLVNIMLNKGKEIEIINSDVGQSNFCLPTTVCKTKAKDYIFTLNDLVPQVSKFTGTITPAVCQSRVIGAVASLTSSSYVLDTDGWVEGFDAGYYKRSLLEAVRPELVIYMGEPPWWTQGPWKVLSLPPSTGRSRSREDRRGIRKEKYRKALEGCKTIDIDLKEVHPLYSIIFNSPWGGEELKEAVTKLIGTKPLIVVPYNKKVIAVVRKGSKYRKVKEVEVIEEGEERGLLVALGDGSGNEVLGEVVRIRYQEKLVKVRTCFQGEPKYLSFGRVKLSEDWSDTIFRKPF